MDRFEPVMEPIRTSYGPIRTSYGHTNSIYFCQLSLNQITIGGDRSINRGITIGGISTGTVMDFLVTAKSGSEGYGDGYDVGQNGLGDGDGYDFGQNRLGTGTVMILAKIDWRMGTGMMIEKI